MIRNEVLTHSGYLVTHPFGYGYHHRNKKHCDLQNWCHVKPEQPPVCIYAVHGETPSREAYNDTPYAHTSTHRSLTLLRLLHPLFCEMCNKFIRTEVLFRLILYLGKTEGKGGARLRSDRENSLRNRSESREIQHRATFKLSAGIYFQYYFANGQHLPEDNRTKLSTLKFSMKCKQAAPRTPLRVCDTFGIPA
jgi:hypothetical protein